MSATTRLLSNASVTTASVGSSSSGSSDVIPKSVITICILIGGFLVGVLVAKLVNYCYNRADIPDNASDIIEHTKELLKIQLALMKFGKAAIAAGADADADPEDVKRQQQATVLNMWRMKAMDKAAEQRAREEKEKAQTSVRVVNEEEAAGKTAKKNGTGVGKGAATSTKTGGGAPAGKAVEAVEKTGERARARPTFVILLGGQAEEAVRKKYLSPSRLSRRADDNNMGGSKHTTLKEDIRQEWKTLAEHTIGKRQEIYDRAKSSINDVLIYRDMPRNDQYLPPVVEEFMENGLAMEPDEHRPSVEVPEQFYDFSSPQTNFILNLLLDANDSRLRRLLSQVHTRALFKEDRYYQMVDDPTLYIRGTGCVDFPAFHNKVVMYLTATAIMIYLKSRSALLASACISGSGVPPRSAPMEKAREARQSKRKKPQSEFAAVKAYEAKKKNNLVPLFNVYAFQYATYVHCSDGDILRFQMDYLAIRRHFYDAFPFLLQMDWRPNSPSILMYRRRYYQFMTPFLDWVDLIRYIMKKCPTLSAAAIYERMINCHNENITLTDMKYLGQTMLECFEIRKLSKANCKLKAYYGVYVGRKILKDKEPQTHADYKEAFGQGMAVRPVIPQVCSPTRRFLVHLYYYDKASMSTMAQVVSVIDFMLRMDFFSMHPLCKLSTIHLEPLIFQIYDFVWMIRKDNIGRKVYLRNETWESIRSNEEAYAWYLRWDVLNCVSLLFGVCQNALIKDLNEAVIERLVTLIIEVLRCSEYLESVMSYSFFDTYFGLTSTVNCVPNLQSRCVLRVLKRLPLYLVESFKSPALLGMFTHRFWRGASDQQKPPPHTLEEIGEFLVLRNRRMSMKTAAEGGGEAMSGTSAMGAGGAVTLFFRDYDSMPEITAEDEQAMDNDRNDNTRKEEEERVHVADYKRNEIDFRYSQIFTDSFFQATGRPRIFYDETTQMKMCKQRSKELFKPQ